MSEVGNDVLLQQFHFSLETIHRRNVEVAEMESRSETRRWYLTDILESETLQRCYFSKFVSVLHSEGEERTSVVLEESAAAVALARSCYTPIASSKASAGVQTGDAPIIPKNPTRPSSAMYTRSHARAVQARPSPFIVEYTVPQKLSSAHVELHLEGRRAIRVAAVSPTVQPRGHALLSQCIFEKGDTVVRFAHVCPECASSLPVSCETGSGTNPISSAIRKERVCETLSRKHLVLLHAVEQTWDSPACDIVETVARVVIPFATGVFSIKVDYSARVLLLCDEQGEVVSRDGTWCSRAASIPASQLRLGIALIVAGSLVDVL